MRIGERGRLRPRTRTRVLRQGARWLMATLFRLEVPYHENGRRRTSNIWRWFESSDGQGAMVADDRARTRLQLLGAMTQ